MKLNKLTSAVSVSLLAVALTACGSDDDAPIIGATPAPTTTTPTTPAPAVDNTAKIAQIKANAIAAGLNETNATAFANSAVNLEIGSQAYLAELDAALKKQNATNAGSNSGAVSEVVEKINPFINGVDTSKLPTVTANQYTRQMGSTFDRTANPEEIGGLGAVGIDDPTAQNPYLSNYVLAVEVVTDAQGKKVVTAIDSTGELVKSDGTGKVANADSPYATNNGLVYTTDSGTNGTRNYAYAAYTTTLTPIPAGAIPAGAPTTTTYDGYKRDAAVYNTGAAATAGQGTSQLDTAFATATGANAAIYSIQDVNKANVLVNTTLAQAAVNVAKGDAMPAGITAPGVGITDAATSVGANATIHHSGLLVYTKDAVSVGNTTGKAQGIKKPVVGQEENIYQLNSAGTKLEVINSVNPADGATGNLVSKEAVFGISGTANAVPYATGVTTVKEANYGTEGFVAADKGVSVANNLETRVFGKNYAAYEAGASGAQTSDNTYLGRYNTKSNLVVVAPAKLEHVQYGRLTNNIDVLANRKGDEGRAIVYRQFQQHGAANTVDTYFYRGTNKTTIAQMDALKARGGKVQYYGHALTYNVGPKVPEGNTTNNLPTAYGLTSSEATIGNFVQAKYDIAKSEVDGSIYNFRNENVAKDKDAFKKQDLISFKGVVSGNTVIGTANKIGTNETGTLTASFFGNAANELGGSISSIQRSEGYSTPKWGAVFGATRGTSVENFNVIEETTGN